MKYDRQVGPIRALRNQLFRVRKRSALTIALRTLIHYDGTLPSFLVIGAERGGSTSMFEYLARNPALDASLVKEVHYFDVHFPRGLAWYKAHFEASRSNHKAITFEASPYLFLPHVERRISQLIPDVKLIVLLRNPIERAYSYYNLMIRFKRETRTFEETIAEEPEILATDLTRMQADETFWSKRIILGAHLAKGIYVDQLKRWERFFPRNQFLYLCSEDFYRDPEAALRQVADFVGFPHHGLDSYPRFLATSGSPMNPDTRQRLVEYYKEHNAHLYEYLGRDLGWDR